MASGNQGFRVSTWVKNTGKSFGYAVGDTFKQYNPVITKITSEAKDTASSLYRSIKDVGFNKSSVDEKGLKGEVKDTISDIFKNMKDDIKTGNFYNKQRANAMDNAMMSAMGFDMSELEDLNFDFDEDWGDDDFGSSPDKGSAAEIVGDMAVANKQSAQLANAMSVVGSKSASAIASATTESATYIVSSVKQQNRALYDLNQRGFNQVTSGLIAVNNTIAEFAKLGEPLTAHMNNFSVFATKTTDQLNKIQSSLEQIAKNTAPVVANDRRYNTKKGTFSDVFTDEGISISAMQDMFKENFKGNKDLLDGAMNVLKGFKGSGGGSYGKNISVMTIATKMMSNVIMPTVLKKSMEGLNDAIKEVSGAAILKMRGKSTGNILLDFVKDMFLPQSGYKDKISTSGYEKGRISFDGITRQSFTKVIPEILFKIYSTLSGNPEMTYNYDTGKFVKKSSVNRDFAQRKQRAAEDAAGEFREDIMKAVAGATKGNKGKRDKLAKEVTDFFINVLGDQSLLLDIRDKNYLSHHKNSGLSNESLRIIVQQMNEYRNTGKRTATKAVNRMALKGDEFGDWVRQQEASGSSVYTSLNDGWQDEAKKNNVTTRGGMFFDQYKHDQLYYLRQIFLYTQYAAQHRTYGTAASVEGGDKGEDFSSFKHKANIKEIKALREQREAELRQIAKLKAKEYDPMDRFESDYDRDQREREEKNKKINDKVQEWTKNKGSKLLKYFGISSEGLGALQGPAKAVSNFLNSIGYSLDGLIWGKDGDDYDGKKGLFGFIFDHAENMMDKLFNKFFDTDFRTKMNEWMDKLFGEKDETGKRNKRAGALWEFKERTINELKNIGKSTFGSVKSFFGKTPTETEGAAKGRKVTKPGVIAVSGGELIIPSELNPYYHGATNKAWQIANERRLARNFYGYYAEGGPVSGEGETVDVNLTKDETAYTEGAGRKFVREGIDYLSAGFKRAFDTLVGTKDPEKEKKEIFKSLKEAIKKDVKDKETWGRIGAGGILGGLGLPLITGSLIGPIGGLAIGAGIGFLSKSQAAQNALFGEFDEDDNQTKQGILPKKMAEFIHKNAKSGAFGAAGKGAGLGFLGGSFLGSPVMGMIIGSGIGFATKSEAAQDFLFGKKDENGQRTGGVIPKDVMSFFKKRAPQLSAGLIAGLVAGPFGIVGNSILGASLGYISTTERFKNWMFGKTKKNGEHKDGFLDKIRDKILGNIEGIAANLGNLIIGGTKNIIGKIGDFFAKRIKEGKDGERGGLFGAIGKVLNVAQVVPEFLANRGINVAGLGLGSVRRLLERRNLKKGYNVYDKKKHRNLYAAERANLREKRFKLNITGNSAAHFDKFLGGIDDIDQVEAIESLMEDATDSTVDYETRMSRMAELQNQLGEYGAEGVKFKKLSDVRKALDALRHEKGDKRFAKAVEEKQKKREDEKFNAIIDISKNVKNMIRMAINPEEREKVAQENHISMAATGTATTGVQLASNAANSAGSFGVDTTGDGNADMVSQPTDYGIVQYKKDRNGDMEPNIADKQTRETLENREEFQSSVKSVGKLGGVLGGIGASVGNLFKYIFKRDKDEEKKGLLGGIFDMIGKAKSWLFGENGEGGIFEKIITAITTSKMVGGLGNGGPGSGKGGKLGTVSKILSTLKGASGIATAALFIAGITGMLDEPAHELSDEYGDPNKEDLQIYTYNGVEYYMNDNGLLVERKTGRVLSQQETSMIISNSQTKRTTAKADAATYQENMARGTAKQIIRGKRTLPGHTAKLAKQQLAVKDLKSQIANLESRGIYIPEAEKKKMLKETRSAAGKKLRYGGEGLSGAKEVNRTNLAKYSTQADEMAKRGKAAASKYTVKSPTVKSVTPKASNVSVKVNTATKSTSKTASTVTESVVNKPNAWSKYNDPALKAHNTVDAATELKAREAASSGITKLIGKIGDFVNDYCPSFSKFVEGLKKGIAKIGEVIAKTKITASIGKALKGIFGTVTDIIAAVPFLGTAISLLFYLSDFQQGVSDAGKMLDIVDQDWMIPSEYKNLCGFTYMILEAIPVIGPFVPKEKVLDILLDATGLTVGLQKLRTQTQEFLRWYSEKTGTKTETVEQYYAISDRKGANFSTSEGGDVDRFSTIYDYVEGKGAANNIADKIKTDRDGRLTQESYKYLEGVWNKYLQKTGRDPNDVETGHEKERFFATAEGMQFYTDASLRQWQQEKGIAGNYYGATDFYSRMSGPATGGIDYNTDSRFKAPGEKSMSDAELIKKAKDYGLLQASHPDHFFSSDQRAAIQKQVNDKIKEEEQKSSNKNSDAAIINKAKDYGILPTSAPSYFFSSDQRSAIASKVQAYETEQAKKTTDSSDAEIIKKAKDYGILPVTHPDYFFSSDVAYAVRQKVAERDGTTIGASTATTTTSGINYSTDPRYRASGSGIGGSSGFVSQNDPRWANGRYANSTIGDVGCGPAVASMVGGYAMSDALADSRRYQANGGTRMEYFSDTLGKHGIGTAAIGAGSVKSALRNGQEVIMLGRDSSNYSKSNSPFGPNNHYVLASDIDSSGNITVKDPEARGPRKYSSNSLLKGFKAGLVAGWSGLIGGKSLKKMSVNELSTEARKMGISVPYIPIESEKKKWLISHIKSAKKSSGKSGSNPVPKVKLNISGKAKQRADVIFEVCAKLWAKYGILPSMCMTQGWKESQLGLAYGSSAEKHWNFWGLHGGPKSKQYPSLEAGVQAYVTDFAGKPGGRYKCNFVTDPKEYMQRIIRGGYLGGGNSGNTITAKGQNYINDCLNIIKQRGFQYYDWLLWEKYKIDIGEYHPVGQVTNADVGSISSSGSSSSSGSTGSTGGYLEQIQNAFSEGLGLLFGNKPSSGTTSSGGNVTGGNVTGWMGHVKDVKGKMAAKNPNYQSPWTVSLQMNNGKKENVRTDCSGLVSGMVKSFVPSFGGLNASSQEFANPNWSKLKKAGFTSMEWSGWDKLQEGDILASHPDYNSRRNTGTTHHVEVFGSNSGGAHRVYSGGSTSSLRTNGTTTTGHKDGYQTVWRYTGGGSGLPMDGFGMFMPSYVGGASTAKKASSKTTNTTSNPVFTTIQTSGVKTGTIASNNMATLAQAMIKILEKIAGNTSVNAQIYELLSTTLGVEAAANITQTSEATATNNSIATDPEIEQLVNSLAAIAKG
jgi:hypothetical protein